ncbi:MAG: hypothetical protein QOE96_2789 [Blastocatellia bacterium]|nr:hypothetical protein [Blastocatellia bacterium]
MKKSGTRLISAIVTITDWPHAPGLTNHGDVMRWLMRHHVNVHRDRRALNSSVASSNSERNHAEHSDKDHSSCNPLTLLNHEKARRHNVASVT